MGKNKAVRVWSAALLGVEAQLISVEVDQRPGLIKMSIVGMADKACLEAKERIRSALKNAGFPLPVCQVIFNLAPADLPKSGSSFDLAMAVALLIRREQLSDPALGEALWLGELALDGSLRPVPGVFSSVLAAQKAGIKRVYVPQANAAEAASVGSLEVVGLASLTELARIECGQMPLPVYQLASTSDPHGPVKHEVDLADIQGNEQAKRALEIAAAGGHNLLFFGPPGSGKTLLAAALPSILPPLTGAEMMEVSCIYSAAGLLQPGQPLVRQRPWRNPHHSASAVALVGGGPIPKPGEISLAHRGVLFLDELAEFPRDVLDQLRQPMESGRMTISRARMRVDVPARFQLVAAMNPCPCGQAGDEQRRCRCGAATIRRYQQRVSGPLLDRFDLSVDVPRAAWQPSPKQRAESSASVCARVCAARARQEARLKPLGLSTNAEIPARDLPAFCALSKAAALLLMQASRRLHLSHRACDRLIRVSRTIADLADEPGITAQHMAEALQYRQMTPGF